MMNLYLVIDLVFAIGSINIKYPWCLCLMSMTCLTFLDFTTTTQAQVLPEFPALSPDTLPSSTLPEVTHIEGSPKEKTRLW